MSGRPPGRGPAPRRLAPRPHDDDNVPALAAVFLGPLSIALLLFSTGAAFFVSLPCAIAAIVLGGIGVRRIDQGRSDAHRALARIGRASGILGALLSSLALIAFVAAIVILDVTEDSLDGVIETIREELEATELR